MLSWQILRSEHPDGKFLKYQGLESLPEEEAGEEASELGYQSLLGLEESEEGCQSDEGPLPGSEEASLLPGQATLVFM